MRNVILRRVAIVDATRFHVVICLHAGEYMITLSKTKMYGVKYMHIAATVGREWLQ